jgi:hypothetical protein
VNLEGLKFQIFSTIFPNPPSRPDPSKDTDRTALLYPGAKVRLAFPRDCIRIEASGRRLIFRSDTR